MSTVHPAFDIETAMWFADELEAPTLRALKRLLPPRTKIKGYYPNGYLRTFAYSNDVLRKHFATTLLTSGFRIAAPKRTEPDVPKKRIRAPTKPTSNPDTWQGWTDANLALLKELYLKGLTSTPISRKLGCTRNTVIAKIHRMGWRA
jgi:hypothetical protein